MYLRNLEKMKLIARENRFVLTLENENGEEVSAHLPYTGSLATLLDGERWVWVSPVSGEDHKLPYRAEIFEWKEGEETHYALVNTYLQSPIVREAIEAGNYPPFTPEEIEEIRDEQFAGIEKKNKIDFLIRLKDGNEIFVEVKHSLIHLGDGVIGFPDAVSERSREHLLSLAWEVEQGRKAIVDFLVARTDGRAFRVASEIDHAFAEAYLLAKRAGVQFQSHKISFSWKGEGEVELSLGEEIPILEIGAE